MLMVAGVDGNCVTSRHTRVPVTLSRARGGAAVHRVQPGGGTDHTVHNGTIEAGCCWETAPLVTVLLLRCHVSRVTCPVSVAAQTQPVDGDGVGAGG